jgi:SAM-dependent methyltransferase
VIAGFRKAIRLPGRAFRAVGDTLATFVSWQSRFEGIRPPKIAGAVPHDPAIQHRLISELRDRGLDLEMRRVDLDDYRRYLERARYDRFPYYYFGGRSSDFAEKALEHFMAARLLEIGPEDTYIDVASYDSPVPGIYRELFGCSAYRQDLIYPPGLRGDRIGGDAARMAVPDGFATKLALHNSFEHFEGDADSRFIEEAARVLRPGGRLCILPLFLHEVYAIQTNPALLPRSGRAFEPDAVLYCDRGSRGRHGRFYDVPHLVTRIADHLNGLQLRVIVVENEREVDESCYLKFAALLQKPTAAA